MGNGLDLPQEEHVEEDIPRHVSDVDDELVVDECGSRECDGHAERPRGERARAEETEVAEGLLHVLGGNALDSLLQVGGRGHLEIGENVIFTCLCQYLLVTGYCSRPNQTN